MIFFKKFDVRDFPRCVVVTDEHVAKLYGITQAYLLPRGERAKTFFHAQKLCRWLTDNADKHTLMVAVGGGSVGDVAGFCASVFKRGMPLLQVPTTLLAQVDSGIGGKTALDVAGVKNAVGTFYEADTLIDVNFLGTLSPAQRKNGMAEVLKYRMLTAEAEQAYQKGSLSELVRVCADYKQKVCQADPFDKGERQQLNFGHTVGHALELTCGLSHGRAVANGIYYETLLAQKTGLCGEEYARRWQREAKKLFPLQPLTEQALRLILQDKKNVNGKVGFVLPCEGKFVKMLYDYEQVEKLLLND